MLVITWSPRGCCVCLHQSGSNHKGLSPWPIWCDHPVCLYYVYVVFRHGSLCCQWLNFHVVEGRKQTQDSLCFLMFLSVCVCVCSCAPLPPAPYLSIHICGGSAVVSQLTYISWACSSLISSGGSTFLGAVYICVVCVCVCVLYKV